MPELNSPASTQADPSPPDVGTDTSPGVPILAGVPVPGPLRVLSRYRTTIWSLVLLALALGSLQTYTTRPTYSGRAVVRLEAEPLAPAVPARVKLAPAYEPDRFAETALGIIRSRELMRKVVHRLRLDDNQGFLAPAKPQGLDGSLAAAAGRVAAPLRSILAPARPGPGHESAGGSAFTAQAAAREAQAVETLRSGLSVTQPAAHLFTITFTSNSAHLSALVVNTLAQELVTQTLEERRARLRDRLATVGGLVADLDIAIAADRARLAGHSPADPTHQMEKRLRQDEQARGELILERKALTILQTEASEGARIVESAQIPTQPSAPNPAVNLLVALVTGLGLAVAAAFGLDRLDDTIQTPEDITRKLHVPFLGLVPAVRSHRQPLLSGPVPHDFGEAYRALRTSLVFTSGGESTRLVAVTSARPLEGKTTTACNLAMVLAFGGSRVLLIDADMRHPGVHKLLKIGNAIGLSQLLSGQARIREAIQRTNDPNLCVITAGRTAPDPAELLASKRMRQLTANLKQGPFDWIVIDTPPVLSAADAVVVAPLVDSVTLVHGADMTRRSTAEAAVRRLMAGHPRAIGSVLNRVKVDRDKRYYSRYYGLQGTEYRAEPAGATAARA